MNQIRFYNLARQNPNFFAAYDESDYLESINKFGSTTNVDSSTATDIWDGANDSVATPVWVPPTQARIHALVSTSTDDTSDGTGARTVKVYGLDTNFNLTSETVTLNGTTPVNTSNSYTRIYRMHLVSAGSGQVNAGIITATAATDSTITAAISARKGQTLMAVYTVPNGYYALMTNYYYAIRRASPSNVSLDVALLAKTDADQANMAWQTKHLIGAFIASSANYEHIFNPYVKFSSKTDIKIQALDCTDNNTELSAGFGLFLVKE